MNEPMSARNQILRLLDAILHPKRLNILIVHFQLLKALQDVLRDLCLRELAHSMEAIVAEDRHDARNDFTVYSSVATVSDPIVEYLIVEKQLSYHEIRPRVDLFFEIANVIFSRGRLEVNFGVARHADAEEIAVFLFNEAHQI